jgi:hypothetical protein
MRFIAHRVNAAGIDPTVIEVEKRADGDGVVDGFIGITGSLKNLDVGRPNCDRILIHLPYEAKERLLRMGEQGCFDIGQDACDQFVIAQEFRRDRGVGFCSKGALVQVRRVGGNEFADAGTQGGGFAEHLLSEALQMDRSVHLVREHMEDLRVLGTGTAHHVDGASVIVVAAMRFHVLEKHWVHLEILRGQCEDTGAAEHSSST